MHAKPVVLLLFLLSSVELVCSKFSNATHVVLPVLVITPWLVSDSCFSEETHPLYTPRQRIESGENFLTSGLVHFDIYARF